MVDETLCIDAAVVMGMQRLLCDRVLHVVETVLDLPPLLVVEVDLLGVLVKVAHECEQSPPVVGQDVLVRQRNLSVGLLLPLGEERVVFGLPEVVLVDEDPVAIVACREDLVPDVPALVCEASVETPITLLAVEGLGDHRRVVLERQDEAQLLLHEI